MRPQPRIHPAQIGEIATSRRPDMDQFVRVHGEISGRINTCRQIAAVPIERVSAGQAAQVPPVAGVLVPQLQ